MSNSYKSQFVIAALLVAVGFIAGRSGSNPERLQPITNPQGLTVGEVPISRRSAVAEMPQRGSGFQDKIRFAATLAAIPHGKEESFLEGMAKKINAGRLSPYEIGILCEWIADRNADLGLEWLTKIESQVLRSNQVAKSLFRFIAANDPSRSDALLQSDAAKLYECTVDIYEGLLASSPSKSANLFMQFAGQIEAKGNRQIVAEMQQKKMSVALLQGGIDAIKALVLQGSSSSKDIVDTTGAVVRSVGGINGNLNFAFFKAIGTISPIPGAEILDTLRQTSWFGADKLETSTSLEYLAKIDGKTATEQALKFAASSPHGNMFINSAFTTWAESDEKAALNYLNSTSLNAPQKLTLVEALHQTTTTRAVREETTQILLSHGMRLPEAPALKD